MPTLGMHALIGFTLGSQTNNKIKTLALVFGSLIPDVDLIVGVLAYLLPGGSIDLAKHIHRSWSHSLITISLILVVGLILTELSKRNTLTNKKLVYLSSFLPFMALGMLIHSFADVLYIGYYSHIDALDPTYNPGVELFWPVLTERFALLPIEVDDLIYNFLITSDFLTDSLLLYFPIIYLAFRNATSIKYRKSILFLSIVDFVIFFSLTLVSLLVPLPTDDMIFIAYLPGVLDIIFVLLFPLIMHETIENIYYPLC